MVAAFPIIKLGALLIKQISKPLANVAKSRAKSSPFFRTYICMPPAQVYHWVEVKMKMLTMNVGKPVAIPKLNEAMAIELGAELVGEGLIFFIASGLLIAEYVRSARKTEAIEEQRRQEIIQIQTDLEGFREKNVKLEVEIQELFRILHVRAPPVTNTNSSKTVVPPPPPAEEVNKKVSGMPKAS